MNQTSLDVSNDEFCAAVRAALNKGVARTLRERPSMLAFSHDVH
jgi:hypothetical protein